MRAVIGLGFVLLAFAAPVHAAEIKVLAVGALQDAITSIGADFTKDTGTKVTVVPTVPAKFSSDLAAGGFDIIAGANVLVKEFDEAGQVVPNSQKKLAHIGIGVAMKEGAEKPDLSTVAAFKAAIGNAKDFAYSDPTTPMGSGIVTLHILTNAGLLDAAKAKGHISGLAPGLEGVAKGQYDLALVNVSEVKAPGVVLAGPVPTPLQQFTDYDAAIAKAAPSTKLGADFIRYMTAKAAARRWTEAGIEPGY